MAGGNIIHYVIPLYIQSWLGERIPGLVHNEDPDEWLKMDGWVY